jgi:hypothetical protein
LIELDFRLKGNYFVDEKTIDYLALIESDLFKSNYSGLVRELKHVRLDDLLTSGTQDEVDINILAFFIS